MRAARHEVVVCGAGVIGASIAYQLALRGVAVTVVERSGVACAASGKAGGFLALDWCDGSALGPLARKSFAMHAELASRLGADYGYRRMTTFAVAASESEGRVAGHRGERVPWLDERCIVHARLGTEKTTAQVHPARFTHALMDAACERGARLLAGRVEGLVLDGARGAVRGVRVDGDVVDADAAVIAMGPWSSLAREWLPLPPVHGLKGFSVTLAPPVPVPAEALFVEYVDARGDLLSPEIYPRPDGEVYVCGLSDDLPLPEDPARVEARPDATARLHGIAARLSSALERAGVLAANACYRPVCADGLPVMGEVPGVAGAFVATGHSCWGILNAPASGVAMAELITDGAARTVDLAPFTPARPALSAGARLA